MKRRLLLTRHSVCAIRFWTRFTTSTDLVTLFYKRHREMSMISWQMWREARFLVKLSGTSIKWTRNFCIIFKMCFKVPPQSFYARNNCIAEIYWASSAKHDHQPERCHVNCGTYWHGLKMQHTLKKYSHSTRQSVTGGEQMSITAFNVCASFRCRMNTHRQGCATLTLWVPSIVVTWT